MTDKRAGSGRFTDGAAFIDGEFVAVGEARIPILDWGFLRSDATYDVVHVWEGRFFRLDDHIDRFQRGVRRLQMTCPHDGEALRAILNRCVALAGLERAYVEMICTRGTPRPGSRDPRECVNAFYAFAIPFVSIATPEQLERGLHLVVSETQRIQPEAVDPTVKNYHWLDLTAGLLEAYDRGGETGVLVDGAGNLVEGPGFNIFAVFGQTIVTPRRGALEGITRRTVVGLARACGLRVDLCPLPAVQARAANEIFITSTAGGIMPVTRIDGESVGAGIPGPVFGRLHDAYWAAHTDPRYATPVHYGVAEIEEEA